MAPVVGSRRCIAWLLIAEAGSGAERVVAGREASQAERRPLAASVSLTLLCRGLVNGILALLREPSRSAREASQQLRLIRRCSAPAVRPGARANVSIAPGNIGTLSRAAAGQASV